MGWRSQTQRKQGGGIIEQDPGLRGKMSLTVSESMSSWEARLGAVMEGEVQSRDGGGHSGRGDEVVIMNSPDFLTRI
jgi:hypothetical protein